MRAASAAAVAALLLLLTWLLLRGIEVDTGPFDRALAALDQIELAESALHRDVLSARAGLLRDYDPLVREVQLLGDAIDRLRGSVADARAVDRLEAWLRNQEPRLEAFKSANALVQNSLAQFGQLSARLAGPENGGPAVPSAGALASAMLHLALDTSPEATQAVERGLDAIAAQPLPPGRSGTVAALLAHGRLLHEQLPLADRTLQALLATPSRPEREAVRASVLARQDAAEHAARHYRILLYAASVLLLGCLVDLGLRLRSRALALRGRAAFEHMLADISTRLISTESADVGTQVERALAQIAGQVGADRAYLLLAGPPSRTYAWSAEDTAFPPDWPTRAWPLAARLQPTEEGIIRLFRRDRELAPEIDSDLAAAGTHGWLAALRIGASGEITALLGCDVIGRSRPAPAAGELGPLRLALDAVANVVERADLERERARLEARLQQSRRMEALGTFASGIAHNFNNILGAILGHAEMAEAGTPPGEGPRMASLTEICRAGERGRDLVDQILTFGRGRTLVRRPLEMRALVEEAASLLRVSLPPDVDLVTGTVPDAAVVSGDAAQLQQVILNLCSNAAQAMKNGGTITVGVELLSVALARAFAQGELAPGDYVVVSVADTGQGMDEATAAGIFEPFFTTRAAGHGLGLATVREIVLAHGGAIEVRSEPGAGTRFEVWLPRTGAASIAAPMAVPPDVAFGEGETLLLVDEATDRLSAEEELLAALGYEPVGFAGAGEALAALGAAPDRFDAALLCRSDPALGLAAALRRVAPNLPVVLAATTTDGIDAEALAAAGVAEVVRWPLGGVELAPALRRCLAKPSRPAVRALPL